MSFSLTTQSFTLGENASNTFVFSETFLPADSAHIEYGRFFITLAFPDFKDGEIIAESLIQTIKTVYYEDLSRPAFESFEKTLQVMNKTLPTLCKNAFQTDLDMVICVSTGEELHVSQSGTGSLYLLRGNQLTHISEEFSGEASEKMFDNISSGSLIDKDILVLATGDIGKAMNEQELINALKKTDFKNIANELTSLDFLGLQCLRFAEDDYAFEKALQNDIPESLDDLLNDMTPSQATVSPRHSTEPVWKKALQWLTGSGRETASTDDMIDLNGEINLGNVSANESASKLDNTVSIFKNNVSKNWERLFNRRKGLMTSRNNRPIIVWVILLLIVVVGLGFWWNAKYKDNQLRKQYEQILATAQDDYSAAETKAIYDKEMAKNQLIQLQESVNKVINEAPDQELVNRAQVELERINQLLDKVDNVYRIATPTVLYDLAEKRPNIQSLGFAAMDSEIYAYDSNAIYQLMLDTVDMRKIDLGDDSPLTVKTAVGFANRDALVFLTMDDRMIEYKDDNFALVNTPEEGWSNAVAIADYSNYLYFLDPTENEIWRYVRGNVGYDGPTRKNAGETISNGVDIAIDGAIYVLLNTGELVKSYNNEPQQFSYKGLVEPLNNPVKLFADSNPDNGLLYILDPPNERVVVTDKAGQYKAQYLFEGYTDLVDIYVDEVTKKLLVLTREGKVFQVDLIN